MRQRTVRLAALIVCLGSLCSRAAHGQASDGGRIDLKVDASEAEAVLAILEVKKKGAAPADSDWQRLFASDPYARLKKREESFRRDFTDADFRKFVLSPELGESAGELVRTLEAWRREDLRAAARRVLAYLPGNAVIRATVYPVIKPGKNSFVFETATDPAIFLYLDPKVTAAKFENTVAHELHHIGYASIEPKEESTADGTPGVRTALKWMGAFGEGFAMLAAAGSPDIHPHSVSDPEERARWDRDMAGFNGDLRKLEKFFLDVIEGRLKTKDEVQTQAYSFFGIQGPWYTVGYRMAVLIEKRAGRPALIECMSDARKLLAAYNRAAQEWNASGKPLMALWSKTLLSKISSRAISFPVAPRPASVSSSVT